MIRLRPKCTCQTKGGLNDSHYLNCELWHARLKNLQPKMKKTFFFFYPLKKA